ncbi:hypothetical protein HAX54_032175 [Datura stramonium]|uniref:Uncharacterized protein n=1 Tax=Datura stramonium TaxID=4076 RepID=A0ABS8VAD0_DATST|nr:hypothetical protein [Datura stramonium]
MTNPLAAVVMMDTPMARFLQNHLRKNKMQIEIECEETGIDSIGKRWRILTSKYGILVENPMFCLKFSATAHPHLQ